MNTDISVKIYSIDLKLRVCNHKVPLKGMLSLFFFFLGQSFYFMAING